MMGERQYTLDELKLMEKIKDENTKCHYCGCDLKRSKRTVDHRTPIFRGGQTIIENLVVSCSKCNVEKDIMNEEEYLRFLGEFNKYIEEDENFNELKSIKIRYNNIIKKYNDIISKSSKVGFEIKKIQETIMVMKMSAADGYILARDLQKLLKEQQGLRDEKDKISNLRAMAIKQTKELEDNMTRLCDSAKQSYRLNIIREIRYK